MASLLCQRLFFTLLATVLSLPLSTANEDGCSYSYDEVPKSPMNCNPLGVNITFSCFFTVPRDPPTAVRWYYSKQEGECGRWINETTDEFELNVRKIGLTGPPRIFYQHTFIIHNFSSNHNGNYWCQMVTNETVLLDPSQVAHVAVNSNLMNCTTLQRQVVTDGICAQVIVNSTCRIPGSTELQITSSFDLVTPTTVMPTPLTASESAMVTSNLGSSTSDGVFVTITSSTDDLPKSITSVPQSLTMPSSHPNIISATSSNFLSEAVTHSTVTAMTPVVFTDPSSSLKPSLVPSPLLSTALPHITLTTSSKFSETVTHSTVIAMTPVMFTDVLDLSQSPNLDLTPSPLKPDKQFLANIAIGGGAFVGGVCCSMTGCLVLVMYMRYKKKKSAYTITSFPTTNNDLTRRIPSTLALDLNTLDYGRCSEIIPAITVIDGETDHSSVAISDEENSPGIANMERCSSKIHPTAKEVERKTNEGKLSVYHPQLSTHSLTSSPKTSVSLSSLRSGQTRPLNVSQTSHREGTEKKSSQSFSTQLGRTPIPPTVTLSALPETVDNENYVKTDDLASVHEDENYAYINPREQGYITEDILSTPNQPSKSGIYQTLDQDSMDYLSVYSTLPVPSSQLIASNPLQLPEAEANVDDQASSHEGKKNVHIIKPREQGEITVGTLSTSNCTCTSGIYQKLDPDCIDPLSVYCTCSK